MRCSEEGMNFIKSFEKCKLTAYLPTPNDRWTIGWGLTVVNGKQVEEGQTITQTEADKAFLYTVQKVADVVSRFVTMTINQNQFDALVSFVFNVGAANFVSSTLLKKLNAGDLQSAAAEFLKWDHQGKEVLAGLTKRRKAEQKRFNS